MTPAARQTRRESAGGRPALWSTGLTFGTISALFGLANGIIDQDQYTVFVTAVIGTAVVPTLIAQKWFQPAHKEAEGEPEAAEETLGT